MDTLDQLTALDGVFEHAPWVAAAACRPFAIVAGCRDLRHLLNHAA